ncbi:MAG TPA: hypothetical protein VKY85_13305 [Candidatus Angelobacter sp.]|nr:hypothetical protein [Candidatus Angelobacter sp.]
MLASGRPPGMHSQNGPERDPSLCWRISPADSRFGCAFAHARKTAQVVKERIAISTDERLRHSGDERTIEKGTGVAPLSHHGFGHTPNGLALGGRIAHGSAVRNFRAPKFVANFSTG